MYVVLSMVDPVPQKTAAPWTGNNGHLAATIAAVRLFVKLEALIMRLPTERTSFTKDVLGRYTMNLYGEAIASTNDPDREDVRPFDIVVVGGGSFGAVVAQKLFSNDTTHAHRILVLEAGPLAVPEHVQNLPLPGFKPPGPVETDPGDLRAEVWGLPWRSDVAKGFTGLAYCVGGRSIFFGGWAPQLLDAEMTGWPATVVQELNNPGPGRPDSYFRQASEQIGVTEANDFMHGLLHEAMRQQLFNSLGETPSAVTDAIPLDELPLFLDPPDGASPEDLNLLKLEAPLAVQGRAPRAGFFPFNKFSSVPLLMQATRVAETQANQDDVKKRLMVVPDARVVELITADDNGQRRVSKLKIRLVREGDREVEYELPANGVVILANSTIESTRLALESFQVLPTWSRIGTNVLAHLRSNVTIRVPRAAIDGLAGMEDLESSALFLKCRHSFADGTVGHFHFQLTAAGLDRPIEDSEAQLFKKIPDIDTVDRFDTANETHVVITIRGIGEMQPHNTSNRITLQDGQLLDEFGKRRAFVTLAPNAKDNELWDVMDNASNQLVEVFANGHDFQLFTPMGFKLLSPGADLQAELPYTTGPHGSRRDGLGTTHHEAGGLWMGNDAASSVTDTDCLIRGTTNAFVAGPALFPSVGSPNPMLTGVALARRLADKIIPAPELFQPDPGFTALFDGANLAHWRMSSIRTELGNPGNFIVVDGALEAVPGDDIGLFWCSIPTPADFILKLEWRRWRNDDNGGVFLRFPHPDSQGYKRTAYVGVNFGFEVQIDEQDPDPLRKTGAIYGFQAPTNPGGIHVKPVGEWNSYLIRVQGQTYTVNLNGQTINSFNFAAGSDLAFPDRALPSTAAMPRYIGLQTHGGKSRVAFRHIQIKSLP